MNGKGGKLGSAALGVAEGTVNLTLDAGVARDLYQALALALGPGAGGKRNLSAVAGEKRREGGGKRGPGTGKTGSGGGYGGGRSKG